MKPVGSGERVVGVHIVPAPHTEGNTGAARVVEY
jgi:hypothetical protein